MVLRPPRFGQHPDLRRPSYDLALDHSRMRVAGRLEEPNSRVRELSRTPMDDVADEQRQSSAPAENGGNSGRG